jgi:hypothetical protein
MDPGAAGGSRTDSSSAPDLRQGLAPRVAARRFAMTLASRRFFDGVRMSEIQADAAMSFKRN